MNSTLEGQPYEALRGHWDALRKLDDNLATDLLPNASIAPFQFTHTPLPIRSERVIATPASHPYGSSPAYKSSLTRQRSDEEDEEDEDEHEEEENVSGLLVANVASHASSTDLAKPAAPTDDEMDFNVETDLNVSFQGINTPHASKSLANRQVTPARGMSIEDDDDNELVLPQKLFQRELGSRHLPSSTSQSPHPFSSPNHQQPSTLS